MSLSSAEAFNCLTAADKKRENELASRHARCPDTLSEVPSLCGGECRDVEIAEVLFFRNMRMFEGFILITFSTEILMA